MPGEFGSWELLLSAEAGFGPARLIPEVRGFVFIFIFFYSVKPVFLSTYNETVYANLKISPYASLM